MAAVELDAAVDFDEDIDEGRALAVGSVHAAAVDKIVPVETTHTSRCPCSGVNVDLADLSEIELPNWTIAGGRQ